MKNSTSNTANPRILEKESQAQQVSLAKSHREQVCLESSDLDSSSSSSRAAQSGVAIHSPNTQKLESKSPQAPFGELIPSLSSLAQAHINFSPTNSIGGLVQVAGTGWTMAGTIAHLCGIPLAMPIGGNSFSNKYFLDSALCASDVLATRGYSQVYLSGLDSSFAGMKYFLQSHSIAVMDLPYFQAQGIVPAHLDQDLQGFWGLKDSKIFELALDTLPTLKEPFALYVSTIDTHHPDGFVDSHACGDIERDYKGAFTCTDRLIADFIKRAQSIYGDSLSIVVLGDHLSMKVGGFFPPNANRYVFNLFINPKFTTPYTIESTKSRTLSHFDIAPLLLDSVGIRAESFGLGRNPLYGQTLLESTFSQDELNAQISQKNRMYDSFWEVGRKPTLKHLHLAPKE